MPKTFTRRLATEDGTIKVEAIMEITTPGYLSVTAAVWLPEDIRRSEPSIIGQCPEYVTLAFGPDNPDGTTGLPPRRAGDLRRCGNPLRVQCHRGVAAPPLVP